MDLAHGVAGEVSAAAAAIRAGEAASIPALAAAPRGAAVALAGLADLAGSAAFGEP